MVNDVELEDLFVRAGLSARVYNFFVEELESDRTAGGMNLVIRRGDEGGAVAIKNEDLPWLEASVHAVAAMATASMLAGWAPALIASLVILLYKFYKKRIHLTPAQAKLVFEIKQNPGATVAELVAMSDPALDFAGVTSELSGLKDIRRADRVRAGIVEEDPNGRWFLVDV
jgi:hypothetical protein